MKEESNLQNVFKTDSTFKKEAEESLEQYEIENQKSYQQSLSTKPEIKLEITVEDEEFTETNVTTFLAPAASCFFCAHCDAKFNQESLLEEHIQSHSMDSSFTCPTCYQQFPTSDLLIQHKSIHEMPYECKICRETFPSQGKLTYHRNCKHPNKETTCKICSKQYANYYILQDHLNACHLKNPKRGQKVVKSYPCDQCDFVSKCKYYLKKHQLQKHWTCSCTKCGKQFTNETNLKLHFQKQHFEGQLLACPHCSKQFDSKVHMDRHIEIVHADKEKLQCQKCKRYFKLMPIFQNHIKFCK